MDDDWRLLIEYVRSNSQEAFARLVERHVAMVHSAALRAVEDAHLADDVTQAVFLLLWQNAARLKPNVVIAGWLFNAARNISSDMVKSQQRRKRNESKAAAQEAEDTSGADLDWDRLAPLLNDSVARLRAHSRDAIVLRFFEGRSYAEIGASLGISQDAAKMRVSRAVAKLREKLSRAGVTIAPAALGGLLETRAVIHAPRAAIDPTTASDSVRSIANRAERRRVFRKRTLAVAVACLVLGVGLPLTVWISSHLLRSAPSTEQNSSAGAAAILWTIQPGDGFAFHAVISPALAQRIYAAANPDAQPLGNNDHTATSIDRPKLAAILRQAAPGDLHSFLQKPRILSRAAAAPDGPIVLTDNWTQPRTMQVFNQTIPWTLSISGTITMTSAPGRPPYADISYRINMDGGNFHSNGTAGFDADPSKSPVVLLFQSSLQNEVPRRRNIITIPPQPDNNTDTYELIAIQLGIAPPQEMSQWLVAP